MIDRYLRDVLDGEKRVSRRCKSTTCTGHEQSAITQIANGRERQYRKYWRERGRREATVRSHSHPGFAPIPNVSQRPGAREMPIDHLGFSG